ncbi:MULTISPECIES: hypothetical protein [Exiguobacterium]|uniref:hypothetical protein n=1 Tax=Exiguobacterium TaxID=33986 RepID=UPI000877A6C0|nr:MULTISPECIES: hypothetical protein [Exiguobacterium]TCI43092.1 hypothetical protein EVJ31_13100 [Exiguobacterium sp. SH5S32]TCI49877.1 hypothetical protein EVJ25_13605 [Exiguobacterium sp. SH1S4]TCI61834.1 hypothetical protein EVJ26_09745 [Exiguobacterium sp. SH3S1]TCI68113.1 hypothetical protein EVJ23_13090 [Exiguobacterium sp. SH1S1]
MRKKILFAFLLFNPIVFVLGWWNGEFIMITWAAFGVVVHTYYHEQLERLDAETIISLQRTVDSKLVSSLSFVTIFVFFVVVWFFDEMTVPLLDTLYVIVGLVMVRRGLLLRRAILDEMIDTTNIVYMKKSPSS